MISTGQMMPMLNQEYLAPGMQAPYYGQNQVQDDEAASCSKYYWGWLRVLKGTPLATWAL